MISTSDRISGRSLTSRAVKSTEPPNTRNGIAIPHGPIDRMLWYASVAATSPSSMVSAVKPPAVASVAEANGRSHA